MLRNNLFFLFEAYRYTSVATATLCYYLAPIIIVVVSPFVLKEKMTLKKILCLIMALIGMVFVSGVAKNGISSISEIKGVLLGVGAALLYAAVVLLPYNFAAGNLDNISLAPAAVSELPSFSKSN